MINSLNREISEIELTADQIEKQRLAVFRHPHFSRLSYFSNSIGLKRNPTIDEYNWLNENTSGCYSKDFTIAPYNLSFENKSDLLLFKLRFGDDLVCQPHARF